MGGGGSKRSQRGRLRDRLDRIYLDLYLLDMTGLVVWITAGTGGNKADCGAVEQFVDVGAFDPCGWCWGDRETRSWSSFLGGGGGWGSVSVALIFHTEGPLCFSWRGSH